MCVHRDTSARGVGNRGAFLRYPPLQNLTPDALLPATLAECGPDPRREAGVARYPLAGSQRRYRTCWLASGDTIVPWNDSGLAA